MNDNKSENGYTCNWKFTKTPSIGKYFTAPRGYIYAIVTLTIRNESGITISTNPWNWKLISNGIEYSYDSVTHDENVNNQTVEIHRGAEFTTDIVYAVKSNTTYAHLYNVEHGVLLDQKLGGFHITFEMWTIIILTVLVLVYILQVL